MTRYETIQGFVLQKSDYNEKDILFTIYSKEKGLYTLKARSIRKVGAKLPYLLSIPSLVQLETVVGNNFPIVRRVELIVDYGLRYSLDFNSYGFVAVVNEIYLDYLHDEEQSEKLFELLTFVLDNLNLTANKFFLLCYFFFMFYRHLGYSFDLSRINKIFSNGSSAKFAVFSFSDSVFVGLDKTFDEKQHFRLNMSHLKLLKLFEKESWEYLKKIRVNKEEIKSFLLFFKYFGEWHVGRKLQSIDFLLRMY